MGIQSQLCGGSLKASLKRGTKKKARSYKQSAVPGGSIFTPWLHCIVCKAERVNQMGQNVSIPHVPIINDAHATQRPREDPPLWL